MYPDLDGFLKAMMVLAGVGVLALLIGVPYGLWWLFTNVDVVIR